MKNLKSAIFTVLGLALLLLIFPGSVGASDKEANTEKKIIMQQEEITDLDVLYEKAKKEKKEKKEHLVNPKATLKGAKGSMEIEALTTTQLLEVTEENGVKTETYAVSSFVEPLEGDLEFTTQATGARSDYSYDDARAGRLNSTFYFTNTTTAGQPAIKLQRAVASFTILDSSVSMTNRKMWLGASGYASGGYKTQVTSKYTVTGSSREVYAPSTWVAVATAPTKYFGVNSSATMTRNGSSWSINLTNHY